MSKCEKLDSYENKQSEIAYIKSPVNFEQLKLELKGHPDKTFVNYLLDGFQNGFDTGLSQLPDHSFECNNLISAQRNPVSTAELIDTELNRGYLIGPFDSIPYKKIPYQSCRFSSGKIFGQKETDC